MGEQTTLKGEVVQIVCCEQIVSAQVAPQDKPLLSKNIFKILKTEFEKHQI